MSVKILAPPTAPLAEEDAGVDHERASVSSSSVDEGLVLTDDKELQQLEHLPPRQSALAEQTHSGRAPSASTTSAGAAVIFSPEDRRHGVATRGASFDQIQLHQHEVNSCRCCLCGVSLTDENKPGENNSSTVCLNCLKQEALSALNADGKSSGFPTLCQVKMCKGCHRYAAPSGGTANSSGSQTKHWLKCDWESRELLGLCLKSLCHSCNHLSTSSRESLAGGGSVAGSTCSGSAKSSGTSSGAASVALLYQGLSPNDITDAMFLYTEPHSRRIKVRVTIPTKTAVGGASSATSSFQNLLETQREVEYVVKTEQCPDCAREYTPHTWTFLIQVRLKKSKYTTSSAYTRRVFSKLEQIILEKQNNEIVQHLVKTDLQDSSADFYFRNKIHANSFCELVSKNFLLDEKKESKTLIKYDEQNAFSRYKFTTLLSLTPILKWDLVCVTQPKLLSKHRIKIKNVADLQKQSSSRVLLCVNSRNAKLELLDSNSGKLYVCHDSKGLLTIADKSAVKEFTIMDIEHNFYTGNRNRSSSCTSTGAVAAGSEFCMTSMASVSRTSDLGTTEDGNQVHGVHLISKFGTRTTSAGGGGAAAAGAGLTTSRAGATSVSSSDNNATTRRTSIVPLPAAQEEHLQNNPTAGDVAMRQKRPDHNQHGQGFAQLDVSDEVYGYDLRCLVRSELEEIAQEGNKNGDELNVAWNIPPVVLCYKV
ncbi:unnamed protein product [Amoebophrya sp. A120]|nr:unnamed protein product [Amoebophrya sp. A120]|eukprot:GSA120T00014073001.1